MTDEDFLQVARNAANELKDRLPFQAVAILNGLFRSVFNEGRMAGLDEGQWPRLHAPPEYINPAPGWEDPAVPDLNIIWRVARAAGYAVGVHGSLRRDVDLIAAPWTDEAIGNYGLMERLCEELNAKRIDGPEVKPHGRRAVTLQINGYYKPIDLSIMPRCHAEDEQELAG